MANREISSGRKNLYSIGMGLAGLGGLLFLSTFLTFMMHFGDFNNFEANARSDGLRAFGGMIFMILGVGLMGVAHKGLAGSGAVLDPQQARQDLEPWARMSGGLLKDTLDEAGLDLSRLTSRNPEEIENFDQKLRKLHQLREEGILSDEEYEKEKAEILEKL